MKLQDIGFYTLEDHRAENVSSKTPLWRCELILTDKCNFRCSYCRGVQDEYSGTMSLNEAKSVVDLWTQHGLRNIRFSGGEPIYWKGLLELVKYTKERGVKRIAISTNGSGDTDTYMALHSAGVDDFSISLDACCADVGDSMSGGIKGVWGKLTNNIKELSRLSYVTVGVVLLEENIDQFNGIIEFANDELGVSDIRVISAAQWNERLPDQVVVRSDILNNNPILKYRIENLKAGNHVRGIKGSDNFKCPLALDDMAVMGGDHFPCIIYLREQGEAIGKIGPDVREQRQKWHDTHDTHLDPICRNNCLDVCVAYNNRVREFVGADTPVS